MDEATNSFETIFESSLDAQLVLAPHGEIELVNKQAEMLFGYTRSDLIGQPIACLIPERFRNIVRQYSAACLNASQARTNPIGLEIWGKRKDGSECPLEIRLSPLPSHHGVSLLVVLHDTTERMRVQSVLFDETERSRATLSSIGDAVLSTNVLHEVTYLNKAAEKITGWSREEAMGRPLTEVFRIINGTSKEPSTLTSVEQAIRQGDVGGLTENAFLIRRNGTEAPIEDSIAPIHDAKGDITGAVIIFRDVTQSRALERQLQRMAQHDSLTDLPNRVLLLDRLTQAIALARRSGAQLAVLFLDLDHFKDINDSLGHGVGDQLLRLVAERLTACVRNSDTVSRHGGDEFVILLAKMENADAASIAADKLLQALGAPYRIEERDHFVTVSIGVSLYPEDGEEADVLIKAADVAMYHAKESGRNNYRFFTPDMNRRSIDRLAIASGLRQALNRDEFVLYYQPKTNLETEAVIGAEALIRWRHPDRGLVGPTEFIAIAEECNLIRPIGRWVMQEACRQMAAWLDTGLQPVPVAVNISAAEFRDAQLVEHIREALGLMGLDARYLQLELTESMLMENVEAAATVLNELKSIGVECAIDDFGTGFSSLSYLSHFPIGVLKIDQSFVHEITACRNNATIVRAVIGMCQGLRCRSVAEGVETLEQVAFLRACHCTEAQGHYFGRPMAAEDFGKFLRPR